MKKVLIMSIITLTGCAGFADENKNVAEKIAALNERQSICVSQSDSDSDKRICSDSAATEADLLLNQEYKRIIANLNQKTGDSFSDNRNTETLKRLVAAQKLWVQFRDANATLAGAINFGGTLEIIESIEKEKEMTEARVVELVKLFSN